MRAAKWLPQVPFSLTAVVALSGVLSVSKSSALGIGAEPQYTPNERYEVRGDVVFDRRTRLTWQRGENDSMTLAQAEAFCRDLQLDGGGFRVPEIQELRSLVKYRPAPTIHVAAFPDAIPSVYWSATKYRGDQGSYWVIDFENALKSQRAPSRSSMVRCVK